MIWATSHLVVHDEHLVGGGAIRLCHGRRGPRPFAGFAVQADLEGRTLSRRAFQLERAAMGRDDAVTQRKSEPGAGAHFLGGVERLEYAGPDVLGDSRSVVAYFDQNLIALIPVGGCDLQPARLGNVLEGVFGIDDQVGEDLEQLIGIRQKPREALRRGADLPRHRPCAGSSR